MFYQILENLLNRDKIFLYWLKNFNSVCVVYTGQKKLFSVNIVYKWHLN